MKGEAEMSIVRKVTEDLYWVGVNDKRLHLFENVYPIPREYPITPTSCWMRRPCCLIL